MEWNLGKRVHHNKYQIKQVLRQGGFGITYKAIHTGLNTPVAIKVPHKKYATYFNVEIQTLAFLSDQFHPNIVRARDQFYEDQIPCLVMDFIEGDNLFEFIKKRKSALLEVEAVQLISQVGEALVSMHELGFVHRDINPANIIWQRDRRAVLIDFGTAREILLNTDSANKQCISEHETFETSMTQRSQYTIEFAPYEQISNANDCLPTTDIYSLAATLYYLVTNMLPETAYDRKVLNRRLIEPRSHTEISNSLNQAILEGMQVDLEARSQSMRQWLDLLVQKSDTSSYYLSKLPSGVNTDYALLEEFLSKRKWIEANKQTAHLMLKSANRETEGWMSILHFQEISCGELKRIDNLWLHYSEGFFGFSIQRDVWTRTRNWAQFSKEVGWGSYLHPLIRIYRNLVNKLEVNKLEKKGKLSKGQFPTTVEPSTGILLSRHPDPDGQQSLRIGLQENLVSARQEVAKEIAALRRMERQQEGYRLNADQWRIRSERAQEEGADELTQEALERMNDKLALCDQISLDIREQKIIVNSIRSRLLDLELRIAGLASVNRFGIEMLVSKLDSCGR